MAQPFDIQTPITSEHTLEYVADVIKSNFVLKMDNNGELTLIKKDIENLKDNKVDKKDDYDLISNTDLTQITTNKNDIANLKDHITKLSIQASEEQPQEYQKNTVWFDTKTKTIKFYNGSEWIPFGAAYL